MRITECEDVCHLGERPGGDECHGVEAAAAHLIPQPALLDAPTDESDADVGSMTDVLRGVQRPAGRRLIPAPHLGMCTLDPTWSARWLLFADAHSEAPRRANSAWSRAADRARWLASTVRFRTDADRGAL